MVTMYHGSRNEALSFFPGICFTDCDASAEAYGEHVAAVEIDHSILSVQRVEMTDTEMRQAIDDQEWPCDRQRDIDAAVSAGFNAVAYTDCDERGRTHSCIRILTADAFSAAVRLL